MTLLLSWVAAFSLAAAPAPAAVKVTGALPKSGDITAETLAASAPETATWEAHGQKHEVKGAPVYKLLERFGFTPGPMGPNVPKKEKRAGWRKALRVTAVDGFQALFSCAELFPDMGNTRALLIWQSDGKPLSTEEGPYRLVVISDHEPSRSIRQVVKMEVLDLNGP